MTNQCKSSASALSWKSWMIARVFCRTKMLMVIWGEISRGGCATPKSTWQWPRSVFFVTSPTVDVPYFLEATSLTNLMFGAALAQVLWTTGSRDLWYFLHVFTAMETLLRNAKMSSVDCSSILHSRPLSLCWIFHDAQPLPSLKKDYFLRLKHSR